MSRAGRRLTPAEIELWLAVTQTVLPRAGASLPAKNPSPALTEQPPEAVKSPTRRQAAAIGPSAAPSPARPPGPPPLAPLEKRYRQRVARGRIAIEAAIDLHGLTQAEAHAALIGFLRGAAAEGARLVLVVTGKGRSRTGEPGVLRRSVPHWLGAAALRPIVLGFEVAGAAHGEHGALYVRLRRTTG